MPWLFGLTCLREFGSVPCAFAAVRLPCVPCFRDFRVVGPRDRAQCLQGLSPRRRPPRGQGTVPSGPSAAPTSGLLCPVCAFRTQWRCLRASLAEHTQTCSSGWRRSGTAIRQQGVRLWRVALQCARCVVHGGHRHHSDTLLVEEHTQTCSSGWRRSGTAIRQGVRLPRVALQECARCVHGGHRHHSATLLVRDS